MVLDLSELPSGITSSPHKLTKRDKRYPVVGNQRLGKQTCEASDIWLACLGIADEIRPSLRLIILGRMAAVNVGGKEVDRERLLFPSTPRRGSLGDTPKSPPPPRVKASGMELDKR